MSNELRQGPITNDEVMAARIDTVARMSLRPGDILHVKLGVLDLGDGQGPWIPGQPEIDDATEEWRSVVPEGVRVLVTHFAHDPEVIQVDAEA